jgi:alkylation response protein AidB-like acyl-CoA dehydrogenase
MIDFTLSDNQRQKQEEARLFAKNQIAPNVTRLEEDIAFRCQFLSTMGKKGYFHLTVPSKGNNLDSIGYLMALKEISKIDAGIGVAMAITNMVAAAIDLHGTQEQKQKYLPSFANGTITPASFALTEKNAGSDAKAVETFAEKSSDGSGDYILKGEKRFITNADIAGVIIVIAKTSNIGKDQKGHLSAFLLDQGTKGMSVTKKENKLGLLTANLVTLQFDQCRISARQLLGNEGEGLKIALSVLDSGRLGVAAQAIGIGTAAFEAARSYAANRRQFGIPLIEQQAIAFKLADMRVQLRASELLLLHAAWKHDQNQPFTAEASEAKLFCSEAANSIATEGLQIHGGCGYTKDYLAEKYFRDARVTTLYEGTSEIQRLIIARSIQQDFE